MVCDLRTLVWIRNDSVKEASTTSIPLIEICNELLFAVVQYFNQRQPRYQYCAANTLRVSFSRCSNAIKNALLRSVCAPMYVSQLWCNFRKSCMQRLRVACNFGCRALYNLRRRASVSSHQVQCNIPTFEVLLRKNTYLCLERCRKSSNIWWRALMQSDCL